MSIATWRKCDFQIHTPRDPCWDGARLLGEGDQIEGAEREATKADVDSDRDRWAKDFVSMCVDKGLCAVAITDHHEFVMVNHARQEIERRRNEDEEFDLWLFPGMEVTVRGGKQCLVLFDEGLSAKSLAQARAALNISDDKFDPYSSKSNKVEQLEAEYHDIWRPLDSHKGLRGRYIILPNMSQSGKHTVLKDGEHKNFRRMKYVGGYLDNCKTVESYSHTNKIRTSGDDRIWSDRAVYAIPTSDCRHESYASLGKNNCWIKLAEPTAEAIRQAFLAHESRIHIKQEPLIPGTHVTGIEITGSSILEDTHLELSAEMNSIIGGRGSGKSTVIEYISYGLGRSALDLTKSENVALERNRELIRTSLKGKGGRVELSVSHDGANYRIIRGPDNDYNPELVYPDGERKILSVPELRNLFPSVVHGQGQLGEVGRTDSRNVEVFTLLRFVDSKHKALDGELIRQIDQVKEEIRESVHHLESKWRLQAQLKQAEVELSIAQESLKQLESSIEELSTDEQSIVAEFDQMNQYLPQQQQMVRYFEEMGSVLDDLQPGARVEPKGQAAEIEGEFTRELFDEYGQLCDTYQTASKHFVATARKAHTRFASALSRWKSKYDKLKAERDKVLQKSGAHQQTRLRIKELRESEVNIRGKIDQIRSELQPTLLT